MDNAGNKTNCDVSVYVDTTPPTCEVSGGNSTWINKTSSTTSRTITATCTDNKSDCKVKKLEHVYSTNIDTKTAGEAGNNNGGIVEDNVGNKTTCAANQTVKIDKTPPTISCNASNASVKYCDSEVLPSKSGCAAYGKLPRKSCSGTTSNNVFTAGGGGSISSRIMEHCDDTGNCTSPNWKRTSGRCVNAYCTTKVTGKVCDTAGNCVTKLFTYYLKY